MSLDIKKQEKFHALDFFRILFWVNTVECAYYDAVHNDISYKTIFSFVLSLVVTVYFCHPNIIYPIIIIWYSKVVINGP